MHPCPVAGAGSGGAPAPPPGQTKQEEEEALDMDVEKILAKASRTLYDEATAWPPAKTSSPLDI